MKEITNGVYYTGILNPALKVFDVIMRTEYGTSYNSYVVKGADKAAVIEASHATFGNAFLEYVEEALGGRALDYLVLNHCEPDHTGCVAQLVEKYPNLTVVTSQAGGIYIKQIANKPDLRVRVVKDGESIDLGGKTLRFINAPFLHWPDSMFTWLEEDKVLFSCDFLGCHYCEPQVVDTRVAYADKYWESVQYYFDCIFAPFRPYVRAGLEKIRDLDIAYCCTSHGPVLTKQGLLRDVVRRYGEWSAPEAHSRKRIPLFYISAYGNTARIAQAIAAGIRRELPGAQVELFDIIEHDLQELIQRMNESDAFLIGSPTINRDAVSPAWMLLGGMEAVGMQKRPVAVFGSFGWSGEAAPHLVERLKSVKANVFEEPFRVVFVPTAEDLRNAEEYGAAFAKSL